MLSALTSTIRACCGRCERLLTNRGRGFCIRLGDVRLATAAGAAARPQQLHTFFPLTIDLDDAISATRDRLRQPAPPKDYHPRVFDMAFSFAFGGDDDGDADALPHAAPDASSTGDSGDRDSRAVEEHALADLVGKQSLSPIVGTSRVILKGQHPMPSNGRRIWAGLRASCAASRHPLRPCRIPHRRHRHPRNPGPTWATRGQTRER